MGTNRTIIYKQFCDYVRNTFFTPDRKKSNVLMIVDEPFMHKAALELRCEVPDILDAVRYMYEYNFYRSVDVLGVIAIQIYAASKRANGQGVTSRNYRYRLSDVLDIHVDDIASWFNDNQDDYWAKFYSWCKIEHFYVDECSPGWGAGRYVQYPLSMAEQMFTAEDLKYIPGLFVKMKLVPGEDLSFVEFRDIYRKSSRYGNYYTEHARNVIYEHEKSAIDQLYNFYSLWDGTYTEFSREKKICASNYSLFLRDDFSCLDFRNEDFDCKLVLDIKSLTKEQLKKHYSFRQDDIIVFRKNDLYENLWEETRFLYGEEEGIAIIFSSWKCTYLPVIKKCSSFRICRITKNLNTKEFYSEPKIYELTGGLKVGRNKYLFQAPPMLHLTKSASFILDGEFYESEGDNLWTITCDTPKTIKLRVVGYKPIEIVLVSRDFFPAKWEKSSLKWSTNKKDIIWEPNTENSQINGLDFSAISIEEAKKNSCKINPLNRWVNAHHRAICIPSKPIIVNEIINK